MSKRKLIQLVKEKHVLGWDDPRLPTLSGMRRRGYPPQAIRNFMEQLGVGKQESVIELSVLENHVRDVLNHQSKRALAVLKPLKVTITNWEGEAVAVSAPLHPHDEAAGVRDLVFSSTMYIESEDFLIEPPPPKKWFRLGPGRSVRLRYGPIITCDEFVLDESGEVCELKCRYYPESFGGQAVESLGKVKGIIHWVAGDAPRVEMRLYDRLFNHPNPGAMENFLEAINPDSLVYCQGMIEPYLLQARAGETFQFERVGYFTVDANDSRPGKPIFNRTVGLKDRTSF